MTRYIALPLLLLQIGLSAGAVQAEARSKAADKNIAATIADDYLAVQSALAKDALRPAREAASSLAGRLKEKVELARSRQAALELAVAEDIEAARAEFETISNELIEYFRKSPLEEKALYKMHCPMAFNNRGASWLQDDDVIANPYFGASMLRCGMKQQTIEESSLHAHNHSARHQHHPRDVAVLLPEGARTIEIEGREFEFMPREITVSPGEVFALKLVNTGKVVHMWQIENRPETHVHAETGETAVGIITAPKTPGIYKTVCTEPGHKEVGMLGRLIVREENRHEH